METIGSLHREILGCTACQDARFIELAAPVICAQEGSKMMLIGQAPGQVELELRRPFQGRAGRELFRWMASIGISEQEFRDAVYMTSITKCFPGKARSGSGDRRPSAREIELCRPFLERQLAVIRPETILLVGGMAIERYLPGRPLGELIGKLFEQDGRRLIPLPHPSGASRWLNDPEHRELLRRALNLLRSEWDRLGLRAPAVVAPFMGAAPLSRPRRPLAQEFDGVGSHEGEIFP